MIGIESFKKYFKGFEREYVHYLRDSLGIIDVRKRFGFPCD